MVLDCIGMGKGEVTFEDIGDVETTLKTFSV